MQATDPTNDVVLWVEGEHAGGWRRGGLLLPLGAGRGGLELGRFFCGKLIYAGDDEKVPEAVRFVLYRER